MVVPMHGVRFAKNGEIRRHSNPPLTPAIFKNRYIQSGQGKCNVCSTVKRKKGLKQRWVRSDGIRRNGRYFPLFANVENHIKLTSSSKCVAYLCLPFNLDAFTYSICCMKLTCGENKRWWVMVHCGAISRILVVLTIFTQWINDLPMRTCTDSWSS